MTIYNSRKLYTTLSLTLVLILLFSCIFTVPTHAEIITGAIVIGVSASIIIASVLTAIGIRSGSTSTDFDTLVHDLGIYLQGLGYIRADGTMKVSVLQSGLTYVSQSFISAIKNFVLGQNTTNTQYVSGAVSYPTCVLNNSYSRQVYNYFYNLKDNNDKYGWRDSLDIAPSVVVFEHYWTNSHTIEVYRCHCIDGYTFTHGSKNGYTGYIAKYDSSILNKKAKDTCFVYSINHDTSTDTVSLIYPTVSSDYVLFTDEKVTKFLSNIPIAPTSTLDLDVTGVGAISPDYDNFDVIYPGWTDKAESIDNNIDLDLDNDGAIDNVIEADKYYPINVPKQYSGVYDLTQEQAQTGTIADELINTTNPGDDNPGSDLDTWLPVISQGFQFPNIWHYVSEWLGYISGYISTCLSVWSVLPYGMVVPVYASIVLIIIFGLYRKFIK